MDDFEGTYAPQSPDLSEYQSFDQPDPFTQSYQPPAQSQHQQAFYPPPQQHQQQQHQQHQQSNNQQPFDPFAAEPTFQYSNQYQQPIANMPKNGRRNSHFDDDEFVPDQPAMKQGRKPKKQKLEEDICDKPAPGIEEGIEVRTKFPVARIKRIMQADEDVGKVSQVTPTAVCKYNLTSSTLTFTDAQNSQSTRTLHHLTNTQIVVYCARKVFQACHCSASEASGPRRRAARFSGADRE